MRKTLLMAGALLAMTATFAQASGVELAWNHCFGQLGAASLKTNACTVNTGGQSMYASFRPPAGIAKLEGIEVYVDYQVAGGVLPCWWNFSAVPPQPQPRPRAFRGFASVSLVSLPRASRPRP